jgi:hypothetical protein
MAVCRAAATGETSRVVTTTAHRRCCGSPWPAVEPAVASCRAATTREPGIVPLTDARHPASVGTRSTLEPSVARYRGSAAGTASSICPWQATSWRVCGSPWPTVESAVGGPGCTGSNLDSAVPFRTPSHPSCGKGGVGALEPTVARLGPTGGRTGSALCAGKTAYCFTSSLWAAVESAVAGSRTASAVGVDSMLCPGKTSGPAPTGAGAWHQVCGSTSDATRCCRHGSLPRSAGTNLRTERTGR